MATPSRARDCSNGSKKPSLTASVWAPTSPLSFRQARDACSLESRVQDLQLPQLAFLHRLLPPSTLRLRSLQPGPPFGALDLKRLELN